MTADACSQVAGVLAMRRSVMGHSGGQSWNYGPAFHAALGANQENSQLANEQVRKKGAISLYSKLLFSQLCLTSMDNMNIGKDNELKMA